MPMLLTVPKKRTSPTPLGRNLQRLRAKAGPDETSITQGELARRVGVHRQTIAKLESETDFNPTLDLLQRLAGALGVTVADLVSQVPPIGGSTPGGEPDDGE